mmetsp:Transcript_12197/g.17540  ORF Transcript_12197/g.17540 Transcript_12197/m.17540 type:complete len:317 (+) Transcript_12197:291-1241(+)
MDAAEWLDKPTNLPTAPAPFTWGDSNEDSRENRNAYMSYIKENIVLPSNTKILDGITNSSLLSVEMKNLKISGNIDVVLAGSRHQGLSTARQNMLGAFELKKRENEENTKIERQVILQHMAASYLNPDTGLLMVMTDLHERWHFYWFYDRKLTKFISTPSEALFLIEHMLEKPDNFNSSTPTGFLLQASWNETFPIAIAERSEAVFDNFDYNGENDNDTDSANNDDYDKKEEGSLNYQVGELSLSRNKKFEGTNAGRKHRATLDEEETPLSSSLNFMDKEEELEAMLHMALKTSLHMMLGPAEDEVGNFLPPQIEC